MKPMLFAMTVAAFSLILWPAAGAIAQEEKVARGTITELGGASLTVQVNSYRLVFRVDRDTRVDVPGGATKTREAKTTGKTGPHLADVLKVGQSVAVSYVDEPSPRASVIRGIPASAGGSIKTTSPLRSSGTVTTVAADSLTISGGSGGGARFTQTFIIGPDTLVVGKGAGTASASNGGKAPVTRLISAGDHVSVEYRKDGNALKASDIRVTVKGSRSN
jgi:hypothetical protein